MLLKTIECECYADLYDKLTKLSGDEELCAVDIQPEARIKILNDILNMEKIDNIKSFWVNFTTDVVCYFNNDYFVSIEKSDRKVVASWFIDYNDDYPIIKVYKHKEIDVNQIKDELLYQVDHVFAMAQKEYGINNGECMPDLKFNLDTKTKELIDVIVEVLKFQQNLD